jgi:hypothetical protein
MQNIRSPVIDVDAWSRGFGRELPRRNSPGSDREVAMSKKAEIRIDIEAAKALIYWKSLFADEVAAQARRLAAESGQPERVTVTHYRQAAEIAARSLPAAIRDGGPLSDDHRVA